MWSSFFIKLFSSKSTILLDKRPLFQPIHSFFNQSLRFLTFEKKLFLIQVFLLNQTLLDYINSSFSIKLFVLIRFYTFIDPSLPIWSFLRYSYIFDLVFTHRFVPLLSWNHGSDGFPLGRLPRPRYAGISTSNMWLFDAEGKIQKYETPEVRLGGGPLGRCKFWICCKLRPRKLTWNPKMEVWKMIFLFNWVIFRFHVSFRGGTTKELHAGENLLDLLLRVVIA